MEDAISNLASSAIDISDGILQDLSHLISKSGVGCNLDLDKIPLAESNMPSNVWSSEMTINYCIQCLQNNYQHLQANLRSCKKKCHTIGVMGGKKLIISNNNIGLLKSWDHFR